MGISALGRRFYLRWSLIAVAAGGVVVLAIAFASAKQARQAVVEDLDERLRSQIYTPIATAERQALLLAADADLREGVAERNQLRLRRAIRQALPQLNLSYAGVLLPDDTPFYWLPDHDRNVPIIVRRLPIEHELQRVGTLEYGVMFTPDFLAQLAAALSTEVRLVRPEADALPPGDAPTGRESFLRIADGDYGHAYLRAAGDLDGPAAALLEIRVPPDSPRVAGVRRRRNLLWAITAAGVGLIVGLDLRERQRRTMPTPAFAPITNPYIVGNPIRTPEMFFGRDDDFLFARQKLTSERAGLVLVFCGERRSGKTSMLFQILNGRLGPEFVPVLIDMQYFAAISRDQDFYDNVVKEFVRAVYPEAEQPGRRSRFDLPSDSPAQAFERVLDDALEAHPDKGVLFLFDEYEILEAKIDRGELSHMVIPYLAGLLERKGRISFIFTGSRNLEERATFHWRLMMGKSLYRKISYLTRQDTERLIRQPVAGLVDYHPDAVSAICRLTSGQPFYTQVICQNLIDLVNEVRRRTIHRQDVLTIVDGIVDNPLPQMIYFWDSLPIEEKLVLSLLAETLEDERSWETAEHLVDDAGSKGLSIGADAAGVRSVLERLFEKELLAKSADHTFQYRIDLLRYWIRRTHTIWQVVKEAGGLPHAGV